jgi:hypothetical protein
MIHFSLERESGDNLGRVIFVDLKREIGIKILIEFKWLMVFQA